MPHVATSPADLLTALAGRAHLDGDRLVIDDEAGVPRRRHPRPRLDRGVQRGRGDDGRRAVARLGGQPGAGRPVGQHPGPVRRAGARRGVRLHGPGDQPARADVRHGPDGLRGGRRGRRRGGHPRARPERADVHVPAPDRLRDLRPRRRDRRRLARTGLHPGRPLPVQRQEVRRRPRGDDRGDPARLPAGDRRRLPQHRHRLVHAGRPVEAERRRGAARELPPRGRADRAHPDARDGRRDDQRRWRDRRGRDAELDRRGAPRVPRRLPARARRARARAPRASPRSASRPAPRHGGVPLPDGGVAEVKLDFEVLRELGVVAREYGLAGAVQHGASTLPDELFHRFPAVETAEIHLATGFQNALYEHPAFPGLAPSRDRGLVLRERRSTSARPARPTSSSCTRPARRRSGRSSASSGTSTRRTRSSPRSAARSPTCSPSSGSTTRRAMVDRYVHPVEVHRPMPDALREAVGAG